MTSRSFESARAVMWVLVVAGAVGAQSQPQVQVTVADELVLPEGETRAAQRDSAGRLVTKPGDIIRYTLTATNKGTVPAYSVELVDPIPDGTEYVLDSARSPAAAEITCSIDGGNYYQPEPVLCPVRLPDGGTDMQAAPARRYTHVKWALTEPIQPGETATASMAVRVVTGEQE